MVVGVGVGLGIAWSAAVLPGYRNRCRNQKQSWGGNQTERLSTGAADFEGRPADGAASLLPTVAALVAE